MSFSGPIVPLSPLIGGRTHYTTQLLSTYLRLTSPARIRGDVKQFGFYLAKSNDVEHESIVLEKFKLKLKDVLSGEVEARKNSWVNSFNKNLTNGNDKVVASMLASLWRRLLVETSLKKAQLSTYGYALNGNCRSKNSKQKNIKAFCEWCNKEITVPLNQGFTCPCCGVYFHEFQPQKLKITTQKEFIYEEHYEEATLLELVKKGQLSIHRTNYSKAFQITLM